MHAVFRVSSIKRISVICQQSMIVIYIRQALFVSIGSYTLVQGSNFLRSVCNGLVPTKRSSR